MAPREHREIVSVQLGPHDIRRYSRPMAERIVREGRGHIVGEKAQAAPAPEAKAQLGPPENKATPPPPGLVAAQQRGGRITTTARRAPARPKEPASSPDDAGV